MTSEAPDRAHAIGDYHRIAELGRSRASIVSLAVARRPAGSTVFAIKELRREVLGDEAEVSRFRHKAWVAKRLHHDNLVRTLEVTSEGARPFVAMEFVDGQPLERLVRRAHGLSRAMPLAMHLRVVTELLSALECIHSLADADGTPLQLWHGAVSPHKVQVTYEGRVKLLGLGPGARDDSSDKQGPRSRETSYLAPERLYGRPVDRRADVFAVGVMLYEALLWGRPAAGDPRAPANDLAHDAGGPPQVDPALRAIVDRAMSGDPDARYPTAAALLEALEQHTSRSRLVLPDVRDLSSMVCSLFASERQAQHAFIEGRRARLDDPGDSPEALPRLVLTPTAPMVAARRPTAISEPPVAPPSTPAPVRAWVTGQGVAISIAGLTVLGGLAFLVASGPRPATTPEAASRPMPMALAAHPVQAAPTPLADPVQAAPSHLADPVWAAPTPLARPVQTEPAFVTPVPHVASRASRPAVNTRPPPPVANVAAPPVEPPPAHAQAQTAADSPIAAPPPKPGRAILKENPYLQ